MVLHGVFDGDDLLGAALPQGEGRVECGGLAAPGGPGGEQNPMRLLCEAAERVERRGRHAQLVEPDGPPAAIQQSQHDRLTVERGHRRDPQVQLALLQAHPDAPVLRRAPLGDVQLGQELDA